MAEVTVNDDDDLLDAIQEYGEGDTIIMEADDPARVPSGTTLNGEGVTVKTDEAIMPLIQAYDRNIIIENIRFLGPKYEEVRDNGWWDYEVSGTAWNYGAEAIRIYHSDVEVRHCEFSGWTHAGVRIGDNNGDPNLSPHIWGNRFVDNNCRALGYGVVVQGGDALIEWNYFNNNRHDIAGGDWEGVSYEARYNYVGETGRIYAFECHPPGGRKIHIHHNTFEDKRGNTPRKGFGRRKLIRNRGVPTETAEVHNNWFKGRMTTDENGNYEYWSNHEGTSEPSPDIGQPRPPDVQPGLNVGGEIDSEPEPTEDWGKYHAPLRELTGGLRDVRTNIN